MRIDAQYLEMRWLKTSTTCWKVVPKPTRMACLFYDLAFLILPAWENEVLPNYSKRERKNWSYFGVTAEGDLGNRCYKLVVEIAQLMRERLGEDRHHLHAGRIREGTAHLIGASWRLVWSVVCTEVFERYGRAEGEVARSTTPEAMVFVWCGRGDPRRRMHVLPCLCLKL